MTTGPPFAWSAAAGTDRYHPSPAALRPAHHARCRVRPPPLQRLPFEGQTWGRPLTPPLRTLSAFQRENDIRAPRAAASGRLSGPRGGVPGTGHGDPPREAGGASHFGPTAGSLAGDPRTRRQTRLRGGTHVAESRKDQIPRRLLSVRKRLVVVAESVWQYVAALVPEPTRRGKAALLAPPSGDT